MSSPVIDVHTHMLTEAWVKLLEQHGKPRYSLETVKGGLRAIHLDGAPFMTPVPPMFDWKQRIANMDKAGVDIAVTSLTCPNSFFGSAEVSLKAAQVMNDDMAAAQKAWPDRIRFFASLPWQHEKLALEELKRACDHGAVGVMVLANIGGLPLTHPSFANVWKEIDRRELPVLVHPTAPPGVAEMGMHEFQLTAPIGFTFDTTLAIGRCIFDGFLDRYPKLKLIAVARRRRAALPHRADGHLLGQHPRGARQDRRAAARLHAPHLRRQRGVSPGRARHVRLGLRRRQRALRLRLSAHHRRHVGLPLARERLIGEGPGQRQERRENLQALET